MSDAIDASTKKRGRPGTGKGQQVVVRLQPDLLALLDDFTEREGLKGRPEAVRAILRDRLQVETTD